jgi:hypothetical protein
VVRREHSFLGPLLTRYMTCMRLLEHLGGCTTYFIILFLMVVLDHGFEIAHYFEELLHIGPHFLLYFYLSLLESFYFGHGGF